MTALQGRLFWRMLIGQVSLKNLSGPLSIAEYAGESAQAGFAPFLGFLVLISLSLGFLNLLPVPILDGGQIVFQLVEWLKGTPLSERSASARAAGGDRAAGRCSWAWRFSTTSRASSTDQTSLADFAYDKFDGRHLHACHSF